GIAAMLAADAELDVGTRAPSLLHCDLHELADAFLVNGSKRIFLEDLQLLIGREEGAGIIAAHAEPGLGQVVGAEAKELGSLGDLIGRERAARHLDHRADQVAQLYLLSGHYFPGDEVDHLDLEIELPLAPDE